MNVFSGMLDINNVTKVNTSNVQNQVKQSFEKDSYSISTPSLSENLKTVKQDENSEYHVLQGEINNKKAEIEILHDNSGIRYYNGEISGKTLYMEGKNYCFTGFYGDKPINLEIKNIELTDNTSFVQKTIDKLFKIKDSGFSPSDSKLTLEGTVGENYISVKIPNGNVPTDSDTQDVIITLFAGDGLKPVAMNGKILKLVSNSDGINYKENLKHKRNEVGNLVFSPFKQFLVETLGFALKTATTIAIYQLLKKVPALNGLKKILDQTKQTS